MFKICGIIVQKLSRSFKICLNKFSICTHSFQYMFLLCPLYDYHMYKCLSSSDKICQNVTKYVQYLLKLCLYCVQIMLKISSEYVQNPFKNCQTFVRNLFKICSKYHQPLTNLCGKYVQNCSKPV